MNLLDKSINIPKKLRDAINKALTTIKPYKVYTALLTQAGTDDPTVVVLENTLDDTILWTRTSEGIYEGTLPKLSLFIEPKTFLSIVNNASTGTSFLFGVTSTKVLFIEAQLNNSTTWEYSDNLLNSTPVEIRVYE